MSRYRITIDVDGPHIPEVNVTPTVEDDGCISAKVWLGRESWASDRLYGYVYAGSGPLVVTAKDCGGNPNGVPGSVSVRVEEVKA